MDSPATPMTDRLEVYSTCPGAVDGKSGAFSKFVETAARRTESAGLRGLLIFTDNGSVDPWIVAQHLVERTERVVPLVAVQPNYLHPMTAARMVIAISRLFGRRVDLNLVTGNHAPDLRALGCAIDHDTRYERLLEFGRIMGGLLDGSEPVSHRGPHYEVNDAVLNPSLPAGLMPRLFVAGSSPAAARVAGLLGATALINSEAPKNYQATGTPLQGKAIRIGVITRESHAEAWRVAHRRYPPDHFRERGHRSQADGYEAQWLRMDESSRLGEADETAEVYWPYPYKVSGEYCAYLVGSYDEVAAALRTYRQRGLSTLILGAPFEEDDLHHANEAIRRSAPGSIPAVSA